MEHEVRGVDWRPKAGRRPEGAEKPVVSRRGFLAAGAAASAGLVSGLFGVPLKAAGSPSDTSRVVVVTDDRVLQNSAIRPDVVRTMLDCGMAALTGAETPAEAWLTLFPDLSADLAIGLKVNTINRFLSSHPEVTLAIADSLAATPIGMFTYPLNQMLIWDRHDYELVAAGYTINTSTSGVRCFATDHSGVGYDSAAIDVNGVPKWVSRCYVDYSDRIINICLLKNHTVSGVTHSLKNQYGSVNNPENLHGGYCDPYVAALNSALIAAYGPRQQLCVCDAIYGIRYNGPMGHPQFAYNGIVLSQDPVALDAVCRQILEENGCNTIALSYHIDTASEPPYSLGNSDLADIERIDIVNPSTEADPYPVAPTSAVALLGKPYPEPFSSEATIPVEVRSASYVQLNVYDLQGNRVHRLFEGALQAGRHALLWNGKSDSGRHARPGRYLIRLAAAGRQHSRAITLAR
jgi:hypothetical protein